MAATAASRSDLIKGLWPDKALYGSTLILITSLLGLLQGLALTLIDVQMSEKLPTLFRDYPPELTLAFSIAAAVLAWMALKNQKSKFAVGGCVAGILAMSLFGIGPLLALVALGFVAWSRAEGEDVNPDTQALAAEMWPDKALAASVVVLVAGVLTMAWGYALATDAFEFEGYMDRATFGVLCIAVGVLALVSSFLLYRQKLPWVGIAACVGGVLALGIYIVGPILSIVGLVLIRKAMNEDEFRPLAG